MATPTSTLPKPIPTLHECVQRSRDQLAQSRIRVWSELAEMGFPELGPKVLKQLQGLCRPGQRGVDEAWAQSCDGLTDLPPAVQQAAEFLRENLRQEGTLIQMDQGGTILALGLTGGLKLIRVGLYGLNGEVEATVAGFLQPGARPPGEQIQIEILWGDVYDLEGLTSARGVRSREQSEKTQARLRQGLTKIAASKEEEQELMRLYELARTRSAPALQPAAATEPAKKGRAAKAKTPRGRRPPGDGGGPTYHKQGKRRKK